MVFKKKEDTKIEKELESITKTKTSLEDLNKLKNTKDVVEKKPQKITKKLYKYWVYLYKNGRCVNDFGVNEEEYAGVKLLVRREEIKGEQKVIFRELYPESKYDLNWVKNNIKQIKEELNKLKQIERKLTDNLYAETPKKYNYDISDVKLKIQERELWINSIRYGVTFEYFDDFRRDGILALRYDIENNGLKLRKYVKEKSVYTEASENKRIESYHSERQINHSLKKRNDKDWQKLALRLMSIILLGLAMYGVFKLYDYNAEREFTDIEKKMTNINEQTLRNYEKIFNTIDERISKEPDQIDEIIKQNQIIIDKCLAEQSSGIAKR